jgi:hypothetical protein
VSDVYHLFIEEFDALTITANDPVAHVVGVLFRAVKRAQMVHDGDLPSLTSGERKVYPDAGVTFTIGDGDGGATAHPA